MFMHLRFCLAHASRLDIVSNSLPCFHSGNSKVLCFLRDMVFIGLDIDLMVRVVLEVGTHDIHGIVHVCCLETHVCEYVECEVYMLKLIFCAGYPSNAIS